MKKQQEVKLIITYVLMLGLCVYLNAMSNRKIEMSNIAVNTGLFVIVGIVFWHTYKCFKNVNQIVKELNKASAKIKDDFDKNQILLWNAYKDQNIIFDEGVLKTRFEEYQYEMNRLTMLSENGYKCNLEDYINRGIIDEAIERNIMNLVPGVMTGLGILGTFIGLSFGLQNFSTGTAEEISNSIAPLMDGIKVAFHTSIYGMVFSLCFNYIYKKELDEANGVSASKL